MALWSKGSLRCRPGSCGRVPTTGARIRGAPGSSRCAGTTSACATLMTRARVSRPSASKTCSWPGLYTSTARHCTATPYTDRDNSSVSYGNTQQVVNLTQWRVLTQTGFYWMFDGNYATSNHKTVNGYGDVGINDYVFTSGGNSGTHANLKVTTLTAWWNDGYGVAEEIEAQAPNNGVAVMAGDSGGPVFFYHTDNVTVGASGMIQYYTGGVTGGCGSARDANPCGNKVGFTSAHATVNSIPGASLYTG